MAGFLSGLVASGVKELVAGTVGSVVGGVRDVKLGEQRASVDANKINKETARDVSVRNMATEERFGELQATLALADRTDKRVAWIRPTGSAIALYVFVCVAIEHTQPKLAALLWIETKEMPVPWGYLCVGILFAIFALRPVEKWARGSAVTTAQATIAQTQAAPPARATRQPIGRD